MTCVPFTMFAAIALLLWPQVCLHFGVVEMRVSCWLFLERTLMTVIRYGAANAVKRVTATQQGTLLLSVQVSVGSL